MIGSSTIGVRTTIIDFQYRLKNRLTRLKNDIFRMGKVILLWNEMKKEEQKNNHSGPSIDLLLILGL